MADFYISSSGNNSDGTSWANAYTSWAGLHTRTNSTALTAADTVWVDSAHNDAAATYSAASLSIKGPSDGKPTRIISATYNTQTYALGTTDQLSFDPTGSYDFELDGAFAVYGVTFNANPSSTGRLLYLSNDSTEAATYENCTFKIPNQGRLRNNGSSPACRFRFLKCTFSAANDTANTNLAVISFQGVPYSGKGEFIECSFTGMTYRTGEYGIVQGYDTFFSSCDLTGVGTIAIPSYNVFSTFNNCKLASGYDRGYSSWVYNSFAEVSYYNCGTTAEGDRPWHMSHFRREGYLETDSSVLRYSGTIVGGTAHSWKIVTPSSTANISESWPFVTPWIYDYVASTGSRTFSVYFAQNGGSGNLNNDQVWMELEFLGTSGQPLTTYASDWRGDNTAAGNITSTPAAQSTDSSTWTGITATYRQRCHVTRTVNQPGRFRARICVGVNNTTFYVDPRVVVA